jgi:hypothetical protein
MDGNGEMMLMQKKIIIKSFQNSYEDWKNLENINDEILKKKINKWIYRMRSDYKNDKLKKEHIDILSNDENWTWGVNKEKKTFEEFIELYKNKDNLNESDKKSINKWADVQRQKYKKEELSQEHIDILSQLSGWYFTKTKNTKYSFDDNVERWRIKDTEDIENKKELIKWASVMRIKYKKDNYLSINEVENKRRIEKLNELDNWKW